MNHSNLLDIVLYIFI